MGMGPAPATRKVLEKAGLTLDDIDLIEVNEAFAAQYLAVEKELGLDRDKVNVNGGAIALGHPLGMTGTRLLLTLMLELRRRGCAAARHRVHRRRPGDRGDCGNHVGATADGSIRTIERQSGSVARLEVAGRLQ